MVLGDGIAAAITAATETAASRAVPITTFVLGIVLVGVAIFVLLPVKRKNLANAVPDDAESTTEADPGPGSTGTGSTGTGSTRTGPESAG